jgi:hypothetical protein
MTADRSTKRIDIVALGKQINLTGKKMAPCSRCEKADKECVVSRDKNHTRCGRCTSMGKTCDVKEMNKMPSARDWESIEVQQERLFAEEEEAMAKILRLRKQQKFLRERKQKMITAGLNSLDELDELERKERVEEEEKREREERELVLEELLAQPTPSSDPTLGQVFDPALFDPYLDPGALPSEVAEWGFGGGTPQASQGS